MTATEILPYVALAVSIALVPRRTNRELVITPERLTRAVAKLAVADHLVTDAEFADVLWLALESE